MARTSARALPQTVHVPPRPSVKKKIKALAGWTLLKAGLFPHLLGERAIIVAFHRIDDRYPDNPISYSVSGFRRFCVFFKKYFDVVPFDELIDDLEMGRPIAGKLVITFDDGYRDNYTTAAPILRDLGLPATFFIATGFIGSDKVPWWDEKNGIQSEWMDWEQVRGLVEMGFDIGAHTVNHVDLGKVHGEDARAEVLGSRQELERRLGRPVDLFAYPYGRRDQLTEENREMIRRAALRSAPSCCGGLVQASDDPMRLSREPISPWFHGPGDFALDMLRR